MTHPNDVPRYDVTPDQLDALLQRSIDRDLAEWEAQARAAARPGEVDDMLVALAHGLAALRRRVDALEVAVARS